MIDILLVILLVLGAITILTIVGTITKNNWGTQFKPILTVKTPNFRKMSSY